MKDSGSCSQITPSCKSPIAHNALCLPAKFCINYCFNNNNNDDDDNNNNNLQSQDWYLLEAKS